MNLKKYVSVVGSLVAFQTGAHAVQIDSKDFKTMFGQDDLSQTQTFSQNSKVYHVDKNLVGVISMPKADSGFEAAPQNTGVLKHATSEPGLVYEAEGFKIYKSGPRTGFNAQTFADKGQKTYQVVFREVADGKGGVKLKPGFFTGNFIVKTMPGQTPASSTLGTVKALPEINTVVVSSTLSQDIPQALKILENSAQVVKAQAEIIENLRLPL